MLGTDLFELVIDLLRKYFSLEQSARKLQSMSTPSFEDAYVCHKTIYKAVYALVVGELRKELIFCLPQGESTRRPRTGAVDRPGQMRGMISVQVRPAGDQGSFNAWALGE